MNTYVAYCRSLGAGVIYYFLYLFILFIGWCLVIYAVDPVSDIFAVLIVLSLFVVALPLTTIFTQLSSRGRISVEVLEDRLLIRWLRQPLFASMPDRDILFHDIAAFKPVYGAWGGNSLTVIEKNKSKFRIVDRPVFFLRSCNIEPLMKEFTSQFGGISLYRGPLDRKTNPHSTVVPPSAAGPVRPGSAHPVSSPLPVYPEISAEQMKKLKRKMVVAYLTYALGCTALLIVISLGNFSTVLSTVLKIAWLLLVVGSVVALKKYISHLARQAMQENNQQSIDRVG